ncbi:alpha-amylase family glycosyl hydrolase [Anatilimnocola floriformis]|uniref:alpha-amylase family glycosyl hydrolase n=1 Tax=Anatilimnocola floriformis TaxID=2948575 RepID=UPI0020C31648|nr:alpha-amylase family glycosyl hydrolase [Anatilimnocola floriformis]
MSNLLRIPALDAARLQLQFAPLPREGGFPRNWRHADLNSTNDGWWQIDLSSLHLPDGEYEYEFLLERSGQATITVPDPYAEELTRFSGYRGVFYIRNNHRHRPGFDWRGEMPTGGLPQNNQLVIYELPMRWADPGEDGFDRQVGLGTFDKTRFEMLDKYILPLGVNCIELLPIQDSADTLNWGYGTRFFFAPDYDLGEPFDLKSFVHYCHTKGVRVIMDVVMNHGRKCPLQDLAYDWFFLYSGDEEKDPNGDGRPDWGGKAFRYRTQRGGAFQARNFQFGMAEFFVKEYHVDGFRLDEFKGIDNYDFIQDFTEKAHAVNDQLFAGRPFIVIAEDSWRRAGITGANHRGRRVVDSMWDFHFRDTLRALVSNTLGTKLGEHSRSVRMKQSLMAARPDVFSPDERPNRVFWDLANRVAYCTSHDIEADHEQRLLDYYLQKLTGERRDPNSRIGLAGIAFEQVITTFALTLTAAGIPMFLAGEEFADLHDIDNRNWRLKMSDPVDWYRRAEPGHAEVLSRVTNLIQLRKWHGALQRNEVEFFGFSSGNPGFHPEFDGNDGERLLAYCRTGGRGLGSNDQVIVVANLSGRDYPHIDVAWPWGYRPSLREHGGVGQDLPYITGGTAGFGLKPFQARVFAV